jgi:hypothetical protein
MGRVSLPFLQVIDQLDKKRKVYQAILDKGTALMNKPKSADFLGREVKRATDLWKETNNTALDRLQRLKGQSPYLWLSIFLPSLLFYIFLDHSLSLKPLSAPYPLHPDNQNAWEKFEQKERDLDGKLNSSVQELENINQVESLS